MTSTFAPGGITTYEQCSQSLDPNLSTDEQQNEMMRCISSSLDDTISGVNTFYLIYAASLVFYMQAGFAMLCAGSVRLKNVQNTVSEFCRYCVVVVSTMRIIIISLCFLSSFHSKVSLIFTSLLLVPP